jgi:hypothetical protein
LHKHFFTLRTHGGAKVRAVRSTAVLVPGTNPTTAAYAQQAQLGQQGFYGLALGLMDQSVPMSQGISGNKRYDYLVRARQPGVLARVITRMEADPAITIARTIGPPEQPHTLLASMAEAQAEALKQQFAGELIVERDRPLTLY